MFAFGAVVEAGVELSANAAGERRAILPMRAISIVSFVSMLPVFVAKAYGIDLREESNIVSMACPEKLLEKLGGDNKAGMEDGGWKRPESSQGNSCQGNIGLAPDPVACQHRRKAGKLTVALGTGRD